MGTKVMLTFYMFGSPLAGLVLLIAIAAVLFRRGKKLRSRRHFTIALALSISGLAAVGFVVYTWAYVFRTGSWAGFILPAVPLYGLCVLLGAFPFAWAMITLFIVLRAGLGGRSKSGEDYGWLSKVSSVLIVLVYLGVGFGIWRRHWQHNLLDDETASPKDVMAVYGHGAWRNTSPGGLEALAQRPHCPADLLAELAGHDDPNVRFAVAGNTNTPIQSLEVLAHDPQPFVRMGILMNRKSTPEILRAVSTTEFPDFPTILFVNNPNTPEDVLAKLRQ